LKQGKVIYSVKTFYWWSRYGPFPPGEGILPHMGEVIAEYRKRLGYETQEQFARAAGVNLRAIVGWETTPMIHDHERRIFLAKMLKIPPALLGLDWRLVASEDSARFHEQFTDPLLEMAIEGNYYHYEDTLAMAWELLYNGQLLNIADRFERCLRKLKNMVQQVPERERDAWKSLLGQYLNLETQIILHRGGNGAQGHEALRVNGEALKLAAGTEDTELIALLLISRASIHADHEDPAQAKGAAQAAMDYINKLRVPLSGNIYLASACYLASYTVNDATLEKEIQGWQEKALNLVYKAAGKMEPDNSFLKLNLAGVHHERAKLFLQLHQNHPNRGFLKDARRELALAWDTFTPDITEWAVYFHLTEARLFESGHDLEASAKAGIAALQVAKTTHSKKRESGIQQLYSDLLHTDPHNPYVHNLGVELGIFP